MDHAGILCRISVYTGTSENNEATWLCTSGHEHCMHVYGVGTENAQNMLQFLHIRKCSWSNDVLYRIGTENVQNM